MKLRHVLTLLILTLATSACSLPQSYYAKKQPDIDNVKPTESNALKMAFRQLLPTREQYRYTQYNLGLAVKYDRGDKNAQRTGSSAALASSTGGDIGTMAAMDITADIIQAFSGETFTSRLLLSDEWLGQKNLTEEEAFDIARAKTLSAIRETAKAYHYDMKCVFNCDNKYVQTFELTDTLERVIYAEASDVNPDNYRPYKLVVNTQTKKPVSLPREEEYHSYKLDNLSYQDDYSFISDEWLIEISETLLDSDKDSVSYRKRKLPDNKTIIIDSYGQTTMLATPLGREMFRTLGKKLPTLSMGGVFSYRPYAVFKGEVYTLKGTSDFRELRGYLTHD